MEALSKIIQEKYATCSSRGFLKWPISVLRSPGMTGSLTRERSSASYKYSRWSRVDGGIYATISGLHWYLETSLPLTTFVPWKRVDSKIYPSGFSCDTITTPPCATLTSVTVSSEYTTLYTRRLRQYTESSSGGHNTLD